MEKQEDGLLDQAIEGVERLIVRHCELADAALRMSAQVQAAPVCGRFEVLEDTKEENVDRAVLNIGRLTAYLERLERTRERDVKLPVEWERLVITSDERTQTMTFSVIGGPDLLRLGWREGRQLGNAILGKCEEA